MRSIALKINESCLEYMRNVIALHGVPNFVVRKVWEQIHENHPEVNEAKSKNEECLLWETCCLKEQLNYKTKTK